MITANEYCSQIVEILSAHGVRTAYCSPGSRNVPILVSLDEHPKVNTQIVVDERSCGFQALGCALVSRQPVALICTSGTAVLNFAPAVAEAYYSGVPLIVISADRPQEWIDQDDSQTIRQNGILGHIVKGSYDIRAIPEGTPAKFSSQMRWTVNRLTNEAMITALEGKSGPVHINIQLADPLGKLSLVDLPKERIVNSIRCKESLDTELMRKIAETVVDSKVLLVAGFGIPDNNLNKAIREFSTLPNVAVMAETISNVKDPEGLWPMIDSALSVMDDKDRIAMSPDVVISLGGALVSRMLKKYIRDHRPDRHLSLGYSNYFGDCFMSMTDRIEIEPSRFLRHLAAVIKKIRRHRLHSSGESDFYSEAWRSLRLHAASSSEIYVRNAPWSDLKALDFIFTHIGNVNLFLSNGTVVRYSQLIKHSVHAEYCNRGVSGIDGSTATAVGGANSYKGNTTLVSGDMSWIYDSGASTLGAVPSRMKIIVIDNSGGGIFRFIPSTSDLPEQFLERFLCINKMPDPASIAKAYRIEVRECDDMETLEKEYRWLTDLSDKAGMLIIHTPAEISAEVLKGYFRRTIN